jgi:hypothetical protein
MLKLAMVSIDSLEYNLLRLPSISKYSESLRFKGSFTSSHDDGKTVIDTDVQQSFPLSLEIGPGDI